MERGAVMPISVTCPSCGSKLRAPEGQAGRSARCTACKGKVVIPGAATGILPAVPLPTPSTGHDTLAVERALLRLKRAHEDVARRTASLKLLGLPFLVS